MTPTGYTEDSLVEQPAIALLSELGWETFNAFGEFDHGANTLGRETYHLLKNGVRVPVSDPEGDGEGGGGAGDRRPCSSMSMTSTMVRDAAYMRRHENRF